MSHPSSRSMAWRSWRNAMAWSLAMPASCASRGFCGRSRILTGEGKGAGGSSVRLRGPPRSIMCAPATRLFKRAWALRFGNADFGLLTALMDQPAISLAYADGRASLEPQPRALLGRVFFIFVSSFAATPKLMVGSVFFLEGESSNRMNAVVHWPTTGGRTRFGADFGRAALCTFASRAASLRSARMRFAVWTPLCASPNDVIKLTAKTASTTLDSGWCSSSQSLVLFGSEYSGTLSSKAPTCAAVREQFTFRCKNCGISSSLRNVRPITGLCSRTLAAVATFLTNLLVSKSDGLLPTDVRLFSIFRAFLLAFSIGSS
mmetsp:Transcript_17998/g.51315  ORF Transcript_17998/g.51315 Transcript_17998/m.51315 type:complete len:318 (+) Transcript_17998:2861-3814(+)